MKLFFKKRNRCRWFALLSVVCMLLSGCAVSGTVTSVEEEESDEVSAQIEDLTITLSNLSEEEQYVLMTLKNDSSDETFHVEVSKIVINTNVQLAGDISMDIDAQQEESYDISLNVYEDIGSYSSLDFYFETTYGDGTAEKMVSMYPADAEDAGAYLREAADTDVILADDDDITAIVTGYCGYEDPADYYTIDLYFENHTDEEVIFTLSDVYLNGVDSGTTFSKSLGAGNCMFSACYFVTSLMETYGIETVEEITLRLYVTDAEGDRIYADDNLTLTP